MKNLKSLSTDVLELLLTDAVMRMYHATDNTAYIMKQAQLIADIKEELSSRQ
ncbi:hypothetical protein HNR63_001129 [Anoxybacillus kamchatkensis]|uniref:hypothetical protein n=1 Tax=Anoxybacillus ayderensis TaxID=265546 RepID=UPI0015EC37FD|nr:hypothetical protein [Anoxybacillus ayderensis]MBA2878075.1 hypothetical protein [Anoxybacillus ayderensis]